MSIFFCSCCFSYPWFFFRKLTLKFIFNLKFCALSILPPQHASHLNNNCIYCQLNTNVYLGYKLHHLNNEAILGKDTITKTKKKIKGKFLSFVQTSSLTTNNKILLLYTVYFRFYNSDGASQKALPIKNVEFSLSSKGEGNTHFNLNLRTLYLGTKYITERYWSRCI